MEKVEDGLFKQSLKGAILSIVFMLVLFVCFAFIAHFGKLNAGVIKWVNQFLKVVAVFVGCFFSLRDKNGIIKGAVVGIIFSVFFYIFTSALSGSFSFGLPLILELLFGAAAGVCSGVIAVNVRK